jgi:hypothetical protein
MGQELALTLQTTTTDDNYANGNRLGNGLGELDRQTK